MDKYSHLTGRRGLQTKKSVTEIVKVQTILERGVENILKTTAVHEGCQDSLFYQQDRLILSLSHRQFKVVIGYEQWKVSDQQSFT